MLDSNESKVMNHFLNVGIGTVVNILLGLITTPLITRIADPSEYGQLSVFNAYCDILLAFLYIGLDRSLIRFFYDDDDIKSKKSLVKFCFVVPVCTTIILMIGLSTLVHFGIVKTSLSNVYLFLLGADCLVSVWNKISTILLRATYKTREYSFCTVIQKVVYCLVILAYVFAVRQDYFLMLVLASIISIATAAGFATAYAREYWKFIDTPLPSNTKSILKYGLPFVLYSCTDALLDSMDKLTLDYFCTDFETGIYGSAVSLVGIFLVFKTIFETVWQPMQTEHYVKNPDDPTFIQKGSLYLSMLLFFIGVNIMMFRDIACILLGSQYRDASQIIPFLYLGSSVFAISDTTMCGIDYSKKSYLHAVGGICAVVVNMVGNFSLIPLFGAKGAAMATCASFIVYFVVRTFFSVKCYPVDYSLRRLSLMIGLLAVFAFVNTFFEISIITVVLYVACLIVYIVIFKKDIVDVYGLLKNFVLSMIK